jgi:hypothetical protein
LEDELREHIRTTLSNIVKYTPMYGYTTDAIHGQVYTLLCTESVLEGYPKSIVTMSSDDLKDEVAPGIGAMALPYHLKDMPIEEFGTVMERWLEIHRQRVDEYRSEP